MAGALGFEPRNGGTKNRCLTTWLRPKIVCDISQKKLYIVFDRILQLFLKFFFTNFKALIADFLFEK